MRCDGKLILTGRCALIVEDDTNSHRGQLGMRERQDELAIVWSGS
jgi:hypothetical protein